MGAEKDLSEQRELLVTMRQAEKLNLRGQVEEARALCDSILERIEEKMSLLLCICEPRWLDCGMPSRGRDASVRTRPTPS